MHSLINQLAEKNIGIEVKGDDLELSYGNSDVDQELLKTISENKQKLISFLKKYGKSNDSVSIPKAPKLSGYPLSPGQWRLWLASQVQEASVAYNLPSKNVMPSDTNVLVFAKAIEMVVDQHEIMRTVFREDEEGVIFQEVLPMKELGFKVKVMDLRKSPDAEQLLDQFIKKDSQQPFNLVQGPLVRAALVQLKDNLIFYYNLHHIITDGWSTSVMKRDVLSFYNQLSKDKNFTPRPLSIQYRDYSHWLLNQIESSAFDSHRNFWIDQLSGELPVLNLPGSGKRPKVRRFQGKCLSAYLDADTSKSLKSFCSDQGASIFMGLLASWHLLLYRYTQQRDIVIGSPVAAREHPDLEDQLGFYVNTLAFRNQLDPEQSFRTFLNQVKKNALLAYAHQMYPFDRLVEDLELVRNTGRNPIFDVVLTWVDQKDLEAPQDQEIIDTEEITIEGVATPKFDLDIDFHEVSNHLHFRVSYNEDVINETFAFQIVRQFRSLVQSILSNPDEAVARLDFITHQEKDQLLCVFNDTYSEFPHEKNIVDLIQDQVAKHPDRIALHFEGLEVTYNELDKISDQLSNFLRNQYNIQPETLIAVCLPRSEWLVIAILGIIKSGGAYVPIDPDYPSERIDYILNDSGSEILINEEMLTAFKASKKSADRQEKVVIHPSQLAYAIYTSGTTGKPKGTLVEHRNVVRLLKPEKTPFDFDQHDVWTLFHSYCFDFSVWEIFGALTHGAKLIIVPVETTRQPSKFLDLLLDQQVTVLNQTPSAFYQLSSATLEKKANPEQLKWVIFGGEKLFAEKLQDWQSSYPLVKLVNMYGITETTVHVTYNLLEQLELNTRNLNIGKPIPTTTCLILDEHQQLLPFGCEGELYVGGLGVTRGYLNRDELTAQKFIAHPYLSGERLYRTGDIASWTKDGTLNYHGRKDDQIQVRGHRIELGEVRYHLMKHKAVEEALVIAKELSTERELALIAYFVGKTSLEVREIRAFLSAHIPAHMIPQYFVAIEAFPLTINGKIDFRALPDPLSTKQGNLVAAKTPLEKQLVEMWKEVLQQTEIGVTDDFFELGGQSLKMVRLLNLYSRQLGKKLEVKDFFQHTTIRSHLKFMEEVKVQEYTTIPRVPKAPSYTLSDGQQRLWILGQFEGASAAYNIPSYVHLDKSYKIDAFIKAIHAVIHRHDILRTVIQEDNEGVLSQRIIPYSDFQFEIGKEDLSKASDPIGQAQQLIQEDAFQPFDFAQGPLVRVKIITLPNGEHLVYYNMHHIISDGWSMQILIRDVDAYYEAFSSKSLPKLPELKIQYKDFSVWQREQLESGRLRKQKEYWLDLLKGDLPIVDLPSSKIRPNFQTNNGRRAVSKVTKEATRKLQKFCQKNNCSLFMGLLATWNVLIHRYTGSEDIIIATTVAGRDHPDLHDQIGFYVNLLPLRNHLDSSDSFKSLLERIKTSTITGFDHQSYPFDRLVEDLNIFRDTSRNPITDITLSLQNNSGANVVFQEGPVALESCMSKYDLEIDVIEKPDGLSHSITYNLDVYDSFMIESLLDHFNQLLDQLLLAPEAEIGSLDFLSEDQRNQILVRFNDTDVDFPSEKSIIDYFKEFVNDTPQQIAVRYGDNTLTYQEVDMLSNQLACHLREKFNPSQEELITVVIKRDEWMLICMLAIYKLGCAYMPIDPTFPKDRINGLLEDSKSNNVIDTNLISNFKKIKDKYSSHFEPIPIHPSHIAYVIYTSGSTGRPKGAIVEHLGMMNHMVAMVDKFELDEETILAQTAICTSDISIWQMLNALIIGGQTAIYDDDIVLEMDQFLPMAKDHGITILQMVPTHLQVIMDYEAITGIKFLSSLRYLSVAGESVSRKMLEKWFVSYPDVKVINAFGPAEASDDITFHVMTEAPKSNIVPVGKPIMNNRIYVLSEGGLPQPIGVVGEICVAGIGVGRGYLNRAELTEQKFKNDPFYPEGRMYKTGDLGRWLPNGDLEFLGRQDDQVKIRGHRVELGEVEAALLCLHEIQHTKVVVSDKQVNKELIGYLQIDQKVLPLLHQYLKLGAETQLKGSIKTLPDRPPLAGPNENELEYLWKEIFDDQQYLRHGIQIDDHDVVLDVGANVGLFGVFVNQIANDVTVHAFEPVPEVSEHLRINQKLYGIAGEVHQLAVMDKKGEISFNYYPDMTMLSTVSDDRQEARNILLSYVTHTNNSTLGNNELEELLDMKLKPQRVTCEATTISDFIRSKSISSIDLLKIDVENVEHLVLAGIKEADWTKIKQIVIEVHDYDDRLQQISTLLKLHGFSISIDREESLTSNTRLYNVFGIRTAKEEKNTTRSVQSSFGWRNPKAIEADLFDHLRETLPSYMVPAQLILLHEFPQTSNGKINKKALPLPKQEVVSNDLEIVPPKTENEKVLLEVIEELLGRNTISIDENFYALGGDSIKSIQIVSRLKQRGFEIKVADILKNPELSSMALFMNRAVRQINQSKVEGSAQLLPAQQAFFTLPFPKPEHYNQSVVLKSATPMKTEYLDRILEHLVSHHDALRQVFRKTNGSWTAHFEPDARRCFALEFTDLSHAEDANERMQTIGQLGHETFNLKDGPMLKLLHFRMKDGDRLGVIIHHLLVDGISWRILLEDLSTLYSQISVGKGLKLPLKTDSIQKWAASLAHYQPAQTNVKTYWINVVRKQVDPLPLDSGKRNKLFIRDGLLSFRLSATETDKLITKVHNRYNTEINDLLLAALGLALHDSFGIQKTAISMEGHGREEIMGELDISRTVGWFTSEYPFLLEVSESNDEIDTVIAIKESLRQIPNKGVDYGILRYLHNQLESTMDCSIEFNYLGDFGSQAGGTQDGTGTTLEFSAESIGSDISPINGETCVLGISGMQVNNEISLSISYPTEHFQQATMERLIAAYQKRLKSTIYRLSDASMPSILTPSDLTFNKLSMDELKDIQQGANVKDIYELSPLQSGIYFHWLSDNSTSLYFEQTAYSVKSSKLKEEELRWAYEEIIKRHDVLRTSFRNDLGGVPLQIVHQQIEGHFAFESWEQKGMQDHQKNWIEKQKKMDMALGFDLAVPSQMRLKVLDLGNGHYEFIWSHHHILMDGWCVGALIQEFYTLLAASTSKKKASLGTPVQFVNYMQWLSRLDFQKTEDYWRSYLHGYHETATLPAQKEGGVDADKKIKFKGLTIDGKLHADLQKCCLELSITESILLQTAWGCLLGRYNGISDVVFGTVVSGRPSELPGVEDIIGLFINTIPVRVQVEPSDTILSLLKRMQQNALTGDEHHYMNLSEVQSLNDLGMNLIDHILVFMNYPVEEMVKSGDGNADQLDMEVLSVDLHGETNYDFEMVISPKADLIQINFKYNAQVYDDAGVERIAHQLKAILHSFTEGLDQSINSLNILPSSENQLLASVNATDVPYPIDQTFLQLLDAQVKSNPDQLALSFDCQELSYQALKSEAQAMANFLQTVYDVQVGDRVGVCLDRSAEYVLSILGVLYAGAAYVPIDKSYPDERITYMLSDSQSTTCINDDRLTEFQSRMKEFTRKEDVTVKVSPSSLAYVVYTSGSSGKPKGVMVTHRNLLNLCYWHQETYAVDSSSRGALYSGIGFDASVWEIFPYLMSGASLFPVDDTTRYDMTKLQEFLNSNLISHAYLPTQICQNLVSKGARLENVKVLTGGDRLQLNKEPQFEIYNNYGPSENTVVTTYHQVGPGSARSIPIGRPIANTKVYVLNDKLALQPIGVVGELCISGASLSAGYWGLKDQTKSRFVLHPFEEGELLYLTGDLARWNQQGNLEFMGRKDDQVKVRGYRIELGEIDHHLKQLENVIDAMSQAIDWTESEKELVAYVITEGDMDVEMMKASLSAYLPDYMVPQHWVRLDTFPLTANGKLDKKILPDPRTLQDQQAAKVKEEPKSLVELRLQELWKEILKYDTIDLKDDFFEKGGNSLKAIRLVNRIEQEFQITLDIGYVLGHTKFQDLTAEIHRLLWLSGANVNSDEEKGTIEI